MQPSNPPARTGWPLTLGDALLIGGGALIFLFSFAPFVTSDVALAGFLPRGGTSWFNAWSMQTFMVPLTLFVVIAGLLLIGLGLSRRVVPPDREFLGFRTGQVAVGIALFAFLVMLGYALSRKPVYVSFSWGGTFMLIGALAATVGALLNHFRVGGLLPLPDLRRPAAPGNPGPYPAGQRPGAQYPGTQGVEQQYPGGSPPPPPPAGQ